MPRVCVIVEMEICSIIQSVADAISEEVLDRVHTRYYGLMNVILVLYYLLVTVSWLRL